MRRSPSRTADVENASFRGGELDAEKKQLNFPDGSSEELSEREVELLSYFLKNIGRTLSRDELIQNVWRLNPKHTQTRTVDMHVARLREKLRDADLLKTVRGKGYLFESGEE